MIRLLLSAALALVAACSGPPHAAVGIGIGDGGVSVHPSVWGTLGGVGVAVSHSVD